MEYARILEVHGERRGSGYLLGQNLVLTAAHLLPPEGCIQTGLWVSCQESPEHAWHARLLWRGDPAQEASGLDLALLELTSDSCDPPHLWACPPGVVPVRFGDLGPPGTATEVSIAGYPEGSRQRLATELSVPTGKADPYSGFRTGRSEVRIEDGTGNAEAWRGISGGAVFRRSDQRLLGTIVTASPFCSGDKLWMIPVRCLRHVEEARRVLEEHGVLLERQVTGPEVSPRRRAECLERAAGQILGLSRGLSRTGMLGDPGLHDDLVMTFEGGRTGGERGVLRIVWAVGWEDRKLVHRIQIDPRTEDEYPVFQHSTEYDPIEPCATAFVDAVSVYARAVAMVMEGRSHTEVRTVLNDTVPRW